MKPVKTLLLSPILKLASAIKKNDISQPDYFLQMKNLEQIYNIGHAFSFL